MPGKAILFDLMGTCLDWHSSVTAALPAQISANDRSKLALDWRQAYFDSNAAHLAQALPTEGIDITLQRTLKETLATEKYSLFQEHFVNQADPASLITA
jgi:FMN phosphatase YigB (HAD superfamily)